MVVRRVCRRTLAPTPSDSIQHPSITIHTGDCSLHPAPSNLYPALTITIHTGGCSLHPAPIITMHIWAPYRTLHPALLITTHIRAPRVQKRRVRSGSIVLVRVCRQSLAPTPSIQHSSSPSTPGAAAPTQQPPPSTHRHHPHRAPRVQKRRVRSSLHSAPSSLHSTPSNLYPALTITIHTGGCSLHAAASTQQPLPGVQLIHYTPTQRLTRRSTHSLAQHRVLSSVQFIH